MVQVKRVNGRLVRVNSTPQTLRQKLQSQRTEIRRQQNITAEARRLDNLALNTNFGGSIQEFNNQYNSIKQINPEVAAKMKYNPQTIQQELNKRIAIIESELNVSKNREKRYKEKDDNTRRRGEQANQIGLTKGLNRLKNGEFLTINNITSFASKLKNNERNRQRAKEKQREQKKKMPGAKTKFIIKTKSGKTFPTNNPNFKPKGEEIKTIQDTKSGQTKFIVDVKKKEKVGFYTDKTGKIKIPKTSVALKDIKVSIKETKSIQKRPDTATYNGNLIKVGSTGQRKIITTKTTTRIKGSKKTIVKKTKVSKIDFRKEGNKFKEILSIPETITATTKKLKNIKLKQFPESKLENFLKAVRYDVDLIQGLDKRTRIARALGLQKTSPLLKTFETIIDEGVIITRKGSLKGVGFTEKIRPIKFRLGLSTSKLKLTIPKTLKKKINKDITIPNKISLPDLNLKIKQIKKYRLMGFIPTRQYENFLVSADKKITELKKNLKPIQKPIQKQKQKQISKNKQKQKQKQISKTKQKAKLKTSPKKKIATKNLKNIKIKQKLPRPIRKFPSPDFDSKEYNNKILLFEGLYRERKNRNLRASKTNPVVIKTLKIKDTKNRALQRVANLADNRTVRSITIKIVGVTDKKKIDIKKPGVLIKFNRNKNKRLPVIRLIEKPKYFRDTKGESRELQSQRRKKNTKAKPKVVKKKKVSNKAKSTKKKKK